MKKTNIFLLVLSGLLISSCNGLSFGDFSKSDVLSSSTKNDNSTVSNSNSTSNDKVSSVINDSNGYKRLNFTNTVQELDYVYGALPSIGKPKALVIPVEFPDVTASSKGYSIDLIDKAFNGESSEVEWESVNSFFKKSSYGKVDVDFDVMNSWYKTEKNSWYYQNYKSNTSYYVDPAELIIKEYLTANPHKLNFADYDTNGDQYIDAIYLIYTHDVDYNDSDSIWWAYQYYYMNEDYFNGVTPYYFMFAGYEFLTEDKAKCDTHTFIHETGHLFGLEDYYDYDENRGIRGGGLAGADIMDYTVGDHNPFSKMLLGWASNPILITTKSSVTIDLEAFQRNGDFVILANNFDESLGMYQEYFIVEYWTPDGLNEYDAGNMHYSVPGIRVLHVTANLEKTSDYTYFKYENSYSAQKLLILYPANGAVITSTTEASNDFLYRPEKNPTFTGARYNNRVKLGYTFTVNSLSENSANITFTKI